MQNGFSFPYVNELPHFLGTFFTFERFFAQKEGSAKVVLKLAATKRHVK